MMSNQTHAIAFGGPIDTQEVPIIGKHLEVLVGERWGVRYLYEWFFINGTVYAIYAGEA